MKKITYIYLLLITNILIGQTIKIVGGKPLCGSTTTRNVPANYDGFLGYKSWGTMIYKATDINHHKGGTITSIAYISDCGLSSCEFDVASNQKIYIQEIAESSFSTNNRPNVSSMALVYDGNITWQKGEIGKPYIWTTIILKTPFFYNGKSNLMIYFENKFGDTLGSFFDCGKSPSFLCQNLRENCVLYKDYDNTLPDIGLLGNQVPIMQLTFNTELSALEKSINIDNQISLVNERNNEILVYINTIENNFYDVYIYTINGRLLKKAVIKNSSKNQVHKLNISNMVAGAYLIKFQKEQSSTVKKIIIQ